MIRYETETTINAPPSEVWKHLTDFGRHDEWSQHFRLRGRAAAGEAGHVEFRLFGRDSEAPVRIEKVDEARELRWIGGPKGLITGSHYFILESEEAGRRTRFRHGESFSGLIAPIVWALIKSQLRPAYAGFNEDIKRRSEGV